MASSKLNSILLVVVIPILLKLSLTSLRNLFALKSSLTNSDFTKNLITKLGVPFLAGLLAITSFLALGLNSVNAADKPAIEVITHAGAGGGTDVNSRMMMLRSRRTLKQDMVVVNKRGGGGASAMNYFLTRPSDGNTIMTFTVGHAITMGAGKTKLKVEDMAPLARGTNDPQILMVNCKTSPYKTPEAFVAGMKKGDKLKYGGTQT